MLADFGQSATYTASGGSATITGIFDALYYDAAPGGEVVFASNQPRFVCRSADLPATASQDDTLVTGSVTYKVRNLEPDGTGITILVLEKQ